MNNLVNVNEESRVKKTEALIRGRYELNPLALKFITAIIACLKRGDPIDKEYSFRVKDFSELIGEDYSNLYTYLKSTVRELLQKPLEIQTDNGWIMANWISDGEYKEKEGTISFMISPKLRPYLLDAKERFLVYSIKNILYLKSKYSIRMYEILRDWYNQETRYKKKIVKVEKIVELEHLKKILKVPKGYKYSDFKKYVLIKSQQELSDHTDIEFDFEEIKTGRKITHIKFKIFDKNRKGSSNSITTGNNNALIDDEKLQALLNSLKTKENVKLSYIYDSYAKHGYDYVKRNIEYTNRHASDNYAAYLSKALKEDWATTSKQKNPLLESKEYKEYQRFVGKTINIGGTIYRADPESIYNIKTKAALPIQEVLRNWNYWKPYFENSAK